MNNVIDITDRFDKWEIIFVSSDKLLTVMCNMRNGSLKFKGETTLDIIESSMLGESISSAYRKISGQS